MDPQGSTLSIKELMDAHQIDGILLLATAFTFALWVLITGVVYASAAPQNRVHLEGAERNVAFFAFVVFVVVILASMMPFMVGFQTGRHVSGVMIAGLVIQLIALFTNGLLTWGPTVVYTDPVTTSLAYLTRYCEWTPLAGFMTFLAEVIDLPANCQDMTVPVAISFLQLCSAGCGILCPLCPNATLWWMVMSASCLSYAVLFVRVWQKRKRYLLETKQATEATTAIEMERRDRLAFSYHLVVACAMFWTVLVLLYFVNMAIHLSMPPDHFLRVPGLAMMVDTVFDVVAKIIYTRLIITVHDLVFDETGRAHRRLEELRQLLSVLWESSSDVIVICVGVRKGDVSVMLSPSYASLIGGLRSLGSSSKRVASISGDVGNSLVMELQAECLSDDSYRSEPIDRAGRESKTRTTMALKGAYLENAHISVNKESLKLSHRRRIPVPCSDHGVVEARRLIRSIWLASEENEDFVLQELITSNGSVAKCEVKVNKRMDSGVVVAVVRDVSLRHRSAEAEQRTILEAIARHKDAQKVNQFTRHKIKNGLLGIIELCDSLRTSLDRFAPTNPSIPMDAIDELHMTLNETLESIMNEAMARDVIHQVYQPRLERLNVLSTLSSATFRGSLAEGSSRVSPDRFPVISRPKHFPLLSLDPQLIKYIHRHAVSNACKYGKAGGTITTELCYKEETKQFSMKVTNLPGANHDKLVALGAKAEEAVFLRENRLGSCFAPIHAQSSTRATSAGEGGWMMQKCAEVMGGTCWICFLSDKTVLTFQCTARRCDEASSNLPWGEPSQFTVPEGTWGIAVDDSKIQRKILSKLLINVGVPAAKQLILGEKAEEMLNVVGLMLEVIQSNRNSKVMILMDENLDFVEGGERKMLSGSKCLQEMLSSLNKEESDRVIALVRSANDSSEDLVLYSSRSHGYFPKAPMKPDRIRELFSGLWHSRFQDQSSHRRTSQKKLEGFWKETTESLSCVAQLVSHSMSGSSHWPCIREALGRLKESLMQEGGSSPKVKLVVALLEGMRDCDVEPSEFDKKWGIIQDTLIESNHCARPTSSSC